MGVDAELAERLDEVAAGAADVERAPDPEVAPEEVGGDVRVRRDPVVGRVAGVALPVAGRVAADAEVSVAVEIVTGRPGLGDDRSDTSRSRQFVGGSGHDAPHGWVGGRQVHQPLTPPSQDGCESGADHHERQ